MNQESQVIGTEERVTRINVDARVQLAGRRDGEILRLLDIQYGIRKLGNASISHLAGIMQW